MVHLRFGNQSSFLFLDNLCFLLSVTQWAHFVLVNTRALEFLSLSPEPHLQIDKYINVFTPDLFNLFAR